MSRIWRYVLADDNGMAPCAEDGVLSLCCCKPMIRRSAKVGEWVIGFVPQSLGRGRVAWVGQVSAVIPMGEYEQRYSGRQDAIYRLAGHGPDGREILTPLREDYHASERSRTRDRNGKNALIFEPFWYWGGDGVAASEEIAGLAHYYIGQTARNSCPEMVAALKNWVRSMSPPGVHGKPRDTRRTRSITASTPRDG
jgi:hypothetical protein